MADDTLPVNNHVCPVIQEWLNIPVVAQRAAEGRIAEVQKEMDRGDVSENVDLLVPLIKKYGPMA